MPTLNISSIFSAGNVLSGIRNIGTNMGNIVRSNQRITNTANAATRAYRNLTREQDIAIIQARNAQGVFSGGFNVTREGSPIAGSPTFANRAAAQEFIDSQSQMRMAMDKTTGSMDKQEKQNKKNDKQNKRTGVSFLQLMRLVVQFGVAMELIAVPGRIISGFTDIIRSGVETEKSLANINSLVRVSKNQIDDLGRSLQLTAAEIGATGDVFAAAYEAASSTGGVVLSQVRDMPGGIRLANRELQTILDMTTLANKMAVAGVATQEEAMVGLTSVMSGFNLSTEEATKFADIMFATVNRGRITLAETSEAVGQFNAQLTAMFGADKERLLREFSDTMAIFSVVTQSVDPARATTSLRNMLRAFTNTSAEGRELLQQLKGYGANLTSLDVITGGVGKTIAEYLRTIAPHGMIIDRIVASQREQVALVGEENFRRDKSLQIMQKLNPNIRTMLAFDTSLIQNGKLLNERFEEFKNTIGETDKALSFLIVTAANAIQRFKLLFAFFKNELFTSISLPFGRALETVNEFFRSILITKEFKKADFIGKLTIVWDSITFSLNKWLFSGGFLKLSGGISNVAARFANFLTTALLAPDKIALYTVAGITIGGAIVEGIGKGLVSSIASLLPDIEFPGGDMILIRGAVEEVLLGKEFVNQRIARENMQIAQYKRDREQQRNLDKLKTGTKNNFFPSYQISELQRSGSLSPAQMNALAASYDFNKTQTITIENLNIQAAEGDLQSTEEFIRFLKEIFSDLGNSNNSNASSNAKTFLTAAE